MPVPHSRCWGEKVARTVQKTEAEDETAKRFAQASAQASATDRRGHSLARSVSSLIKLRKMKLRGDPLGWLLFWKLHLSLDLSHLLCCGDRLSRHSYMTGKYSYPN
jgi:hypothetical protein